MAEKPKERCEECREEKTVRAWTTHWRTGSKIYPIRRQAVAFCTNPDCKKFRGRKAA